VDLNNLLVAALLSACEFEVDNEAQGCSGKTAKEFAKEILKVFNDGATFEAARAETEEERGF